METLYLVFLTIAVVLSSVLFVLSARVAWRRRTMPYTLITIALGALVARSVVGFFDITNVIDHTTHHVLEHGLDVGIALCLFGAIITMGRPRLFDQRDP